MDNPYPKGDPRAAFWKVGGDAAVDRGYNTYGEYQDWSARDQKADLLKNLARAGAIIGGPIAAAYAIPAIAGSGAAGGAASAGSTVAGTTVGTGANVAGTSIISSLLKNPETYSALASVLGNAGKGAADQRYADNTQSSDWNRSLASLYGTQQSSILQSLLGQSTEATSRYNTKQGATQTALGQQSNEGLQRAQLGLQAPSVRARQSVMGSLMKNLQPVSFQAPAGQAGHTASFSGGLTAAALDPNTRAQGDALTKQALMAQLTGSDVPAATDFKSGVLESPAATDFASGLIAPPDLTAPQQSGGLEKTLGTSGLIASILAALAKQNQQGASGATPGAMPSQGAG